MQETDLHYPPDACPFCGIAAAYPFPSSQGLWSKKEEALGDAVPEEEECGVERTSPSSFLVMRSRDVVAFLDILPMTGGEFLPFFLLAIGKGSVLGRWRACWGSEVLDGAEEFRTNRDWEGERNNSEVYKELTPGTIIQVIS